MAKKRRIKPFRLLIVLFGFFLLIIIIIFLIIGCIKLFTNNNNKISINDLKVNEISYDEVKTFDFNLYSKSYLLIRLNDLKALYASNNDQKVYPASLTKIVTLDCVVNNVDDFTDTSYFTNDDYNELISENASLAGLNANENYSLEELLYALVLPSGGDSAKALENYFNEKNLNIVDEMNQLANDLQMNNSHFTNTTGIHSDDMYITLDDYAKVFIDSLLNPKSKEVLKTLMYNLHDGTSINSSLLSLSNRNDEIEILGGKTGFTGQAGENIAVLYNADGKSYLLLLANANGNPYNGEFYHYKDVNSILKYLYNN